MSLEFCELIIQEQEISPIFKSAVVDHYAEVFINTSPFKSLKLANLTCFDYSMLIQIPLNERLHIMMASHYGWQREKDLDDTIELIDSFHMHTLVAISQAFSWLPHKLAQRRMQGRQTDVGKELVLNEEQMMANLDHADRSVEFVLEFQISVLKLIQRQLDLGIANPELIKKAIECIGLVLKVIFDGIPDISKSSILCFFKFCRSQPAVRQIHSKLIQAAISLMKTVNSVRQQYQICAMLKLWAVMQKSDGEAKEAWPDIVRKICAIFSLASSSITVGLSSLNKSIDKIINEVFPDQVNGGVAITDEKNEPSNYLNGIEELERELKQLNLQKIPVDIILLENLFKQNETILQAKKHKAYCASGSVRHDIGYLREVAFAEDFYRDITQSFIAYINQREDIIQAMKKVIVIHGSEQNVIYRRLSFGKDGLEVRKTIIDESPKAFNRDDSEYHHMERSDTTHIPGRDPQIDISVGALKIAINAIKLLDTESATNDPNLPFRIDEGKSWLGLTVNGLADFLDYQKKTKLQFTVTQDLMRNIGYHEVIVEILSMQMSQDIVNTCIKYLYDFAHLNTKNRLALLRFLDLLLNFINTPMAVNLISSIITGVGTGTKLEVIFQGIINRILTLLNSDRISAYLHIGRPGKQKPQPAIKDFITLTAYLTLISSLATDDSMRPVIDNQTLLLSIIVNNHAISRLYESQLFNNTKKAILTQKSDDWIAFFRFYTAVLSLISDLGQGSQECREQARRVVEKQMLLEYINSKYSVFPLKLVVLKAFDYVCWYNEDIQYRDRAQTNAKGSYPLRYFFHD